VSVGNAWSELLGDTSGELSRLPPLYLLYVVDMIMSSWYDQLSQASNEAIFESSGVNISSPEGARDLLLRMVNLGFRPTFERAQATMHLWADADRSPAGATPTLFTTPTPLFFTPSPPPAPAASAAPSSASVPRSAVSFGVTLSAPPRPASSSLPASLASPAGAVPSGSGHSPSVCWQFVGFVIGAKDSRKGTLYECRKTACAHQHIDAVGFRSKSKADKLKLFEDWKVPAAMKADFAKALQ
jgi:hypothetical protein